MTTVTESIKGFDSNLSCRGHKFEIGQTYYVGGIISACANGFHACPVDEHPLSVFEYYAPAGARFATVEQSGESDKDGNKLASAAITIKAEISLGELTKRAIDWVFARAKWSDGPVANKDNEGVTATGNYGAAMATGYMGAASSTGNYGAATATGYMGAASSTGNYGAATATGNYGAASSTGDCGAAMATGYMGAASSTGNYGAASSTGDCGAAMATGYMGAASSTGNYGAATATGHMGAATATGYMGAASSTGYQGAASSTGYQGAASSTGYQGAASSTGNYGAATATDNYGAASSTGNHGAALASGYAGKVKGADGNALFAVERDRNYKILSVACGIVGRDGIAADVWYRAEAGKLVAV